MTEFESQLDLDVTVSDRALTEARAEIEDELSSVPVDISAEVSGSGGGRGGGGASREWKEQHQLSRKRNSLLREIAEGIDEGNFDRASRSGGGLLGGGAALGAGAILGVGALSSVLSNFSWPELPELPKWPEIPEPGWHPLDVEEPSEVPVEEPAEAPVEEPGEATVEEPGEASVEEPAEASIQEPEDAEVSEPDFKVQVAEPESTSEPASEPASGGALGGIGAKEAIGGLLGLGAGAGGTYMLRNAGSMGSRAASGAGMFMTPEGMGMTDFSRANKARSKTNELLDKRGVPEQFRVGKLDEENERPGSVFTAEGRKAQAEGLREIVSAFKDLREDTRSTQEESPSSKRTEVRVETNVSVDGASRREVERKMEQAKEDALREFDRRLTRRR